MTILTVQLPEDVIVRLNAKAAARHQQLDRYMSEILIQASELSSEEDNSSELLAIVNQIRALPPRGKEYLRPAVGSLREALAYPTLNPNFDETAWHQEWTKVEAEINAIDKQDAIDDQNRNEIS